MRKREVTEEMVERFIDGIDCTEDSAFKGSERKRNIRRGLEAALNPPPEPEIHVSDGMMVAGQSAREAQWSNGKMDDVATIYIAMESVRLKEQEWKRAEEPWVVGRRLPRDRRSTDPK